jgi:hypothetical protein
MSSPERTFCAQFNRSWIYSRQRYCGYGFFLTGGGSNLHGAEKSPSSFASSDWAVERLQKRSYGTSANGMKSEFMKEQTKSADSLNFRRFCKSNASE